MPTGQRLELRQTQSLVMTPQLQQAIRLLQLSGAELVDYVERELEQNPLLERDERDGADSAPEGGQEPGADAADEGEAGEGRDEVPSDPWPNSRDAPGDGGPAARAVERAAEAAPGLREHLARQIEIDLAEPGDRRTAYHLLDGIDDAGYLTCDVAEVARELDRDAAHVGRVLARLQQFDPPGVFARSLAECLRLQLLDRGQLDATMERLLGRLDLVARSDLGQLARLSAIDQPTLRRLLTLLRSLDPKPGLAFGSVPPAHVRPDVLLQARVGGGWLIELNPETLPRLLVNERYHAVLAKESLATEGRAFVADRLASARWLVRALDQRATTLLKVAHEIVRRQEAFFMHGPSRLKPLVLRDVAEALGVHESTVSRATSNKFMATPRGTLELRYFFSGAIPAAAGGEAQSTEAVRLKIRTLIEAEPTSAVLSDDRLVALLRADGVEIARRTVAKYREGMRIPSSVERRRRKALQP